MKSLSRKIIFLLILIYSFILYGNTLSHNYALDDAIVITNNSFTQQGLDGIKDIFTTESFTGFFGKDKRLVAGGRYRPLSIASFAVEIEMFGESPGVSHFINILLYSLTAFFLYLLFLRLFQEYDKITFYSISFITTILFLSHPIHTEVVANIKGRDEIMTLLGSLVSFWLILKSYDNKDNILSKNIVGASVVFFLALMSKENAITFVAIIPLCLILFRQSTIKQAIVFTIPLVISTVVFLIIRQNVLGGFASTDDVQELLNNPFIHASVGEKYATIFYTLLLYIKLLVFPHPLTFDYYPFQIPIISLTDWRALVSIILYVAMIFLGIKGYFSKKKWSLAVIFYLIPLSIVSNIVFPIGTFMNERFVYISSIGFCFIMAIFLSPLLNNKKYSKISLLVLLLVVISYSAKTITRNTAWKDDLTLFTTDVKTSFNSAKSTCSAGGKLLEAAKANNVPDEKNLQLEQSLYYLRQSIRIYPEYTEANLLLGNCHFEFDNFDSTLYYYKKVLQRAPMHEQALQNLQIVLNKINDTDTKLAYLLDFYAINSVDYNINYKLGQTFGKEKGDIGKAVFYLERAVKIDPNKKESLKDLGVAYGMSGKLDDAIAMLKKALQIDPNDYQTYINIGITLQRLGKMEEGSGYLVKAQELQKKQKAE